MGQDSHLEPGVCYAAFPTVEHAEARAYEAIASLSRALAVTPLEAQQMLANGTAGVEIRARRRLTGRGAMRQLVARSHSPGCWCGCS